MPSQTPSIGRLVHTRYDNQICAAIITYVGDDGAVNLAVFDYYGGLHQRQNVPVVESVSEPGAEGCAFPVYVPPPKAATPAAVTPDPVPAP